ncbi:MAG: hypothetical protein KAS18_04875, partial [Calditrichia bacterium]|nr:hypothetical protein [Calditrichia bacterium]
MNKILQTPLYNHLYYDFLQSDQKILRYLPDFKTTNWSELTKSALSQNTIYSDVKELLTKDNSDITSERGLKNL